MKKPTQSSGFWAGGQGEYLEALEQEEREKLEPLEEALRDEIDPTQREQIETQIEAIQVDYRAKRKAAGKSLY